MPRNSRTGYGFGNPLPALSPTPVISTRAPLTSDLNSEIGTTWINTATNQAWTMTGSAAGAATWSLSSPGASDVDTLTGDAGGAISPVAGNINILGTGTSTVTGAGNTLTISPGANGFPVTPYVVGAVGEAGYQTIAAAIIAATASGTDQTIIVQPGTYTENLILVDGINIQGSTDENTIITGVHTPPAAGDFQFQNVTLTSGTDIFNSAVAGTANLVLEFCIINCTNGHTFDLLNWTGFLGIFDCGDVSTSNGVINNTGGATIEIIASDVGVGANTYVMSGGAVKIRDTDVYVAGTFGGAGTADIASSVFWNTLTSADTNTVYLGNTIFATGVNSCISHGSANQMDIDNIVFATSNVTAIAGAGAGALSVGHISFDDVAVIANTLTVAYERATGRISGYIVGPSGNYVTVQAAVDAANASGIDQTVIVQPGTYTEDLTLYDGINIQGNTDENTVITGVHTPPAAGDFQFQNLTLTSPTDIFNSAAAGTANLVLEECIVNCTNGHTFDLLNWTGFLGIFDCGDVSTSNGVVNNTGGATIEMAASNVGVGAGTFTMSGGAVKIRGTDIYVAGTFGGAATVDISSCVLWNTVTSAGTAIVQFGSCIFATGANAAISHGSAGIMEIDNTAIATSNNPAIAGAGAGVLTIGTTTFTDIAVLAGTLTLAYDQTTTGLIDATGAHLLNSGAGNDITFTMGDNAGANGVIFNDLAGAPVLTIDSNGGITPAGAFAVVGAFTQTAGIANIGADAAANAINIGTGAAAKVVTMGSVTGASSLDLLAGTGNFTLEGNVATTYAISNTGVNTGQVDIAGGTGARTINIGAGGTGAKTINIGAAASADLITIGDATGAGSLDLVSGTGNFTLEGNVATTYAISNTGVNTGQVDIAGGTGARTINIGGGGTGVKTINIGATASADLIAMTGITTADFVTRTGDDIGFTQSPLTCTAANTGGVATGATGDINLLTFQEGMIMEQFILGAGQTIIKPVMTATGLLVSGDETTTEGFEYNFGAARANSRHSFTIGTSPAFFLRMTFRADDISGLEPCYCGFRRTQANQAVGNILLYTDFVGYGPNDGIAPGDAAIETQLNTGGAVQTDTNDAWADTATHELTILVSNAGVVTFEFDGGAPTVTQAFTFDNGDVVHPYFRHEFNAVLPDAIEWIDFQCGFQ